MENFLNIFTIAGAGIPPDLYTFPNGTGLYMHFNFISTVVLPPLKTPWSAAV
jgi:hypothetical protein